MEARSLADLNILAANPPQYPINPAEEKLQPLILYISRVPGTRDVILSTLKPLDEIVGPRDIAASFYYIIFDNSVSLQPDVYHEYSDLSPSGRTIPRKPLPQQNDLLTPDHPQDTTALEPSWPSTRLQNKMPVRKPVASRPRSNDEVFVTATPASPVPSPKQEPFTSTEREYEPYFSDRPSSHYAQSPHPSPKIEQEGRRNTRPMSYPNDSSQGTLNQTREAGSLTPPGRLSTSSHLRRPSDLFTLKLIRRDPSSGKQWNVATISSQQIKSMYSDDGQSQNTPSPSPPIDIMLETSGYAKFRNMPPSRGGGAEGSHDDRASRDYGVFSRQVSMAYTKSWSSNFVENSKIITSNFKENSKAFSTSLKEKSMSLKDKWDKAAAARGNIRSSNGRGHGKQQSISTVKPVSPTLDIKSDPVQSGPRMKEKGYAFTSPWDGRCEFQTNHTGRSVSCTHTMHNGATSSYNPLVAEQQHAASHTNSTSPLISELRFNLPNNSEGSGSSSSGHGHQRPSSFNKLWQKGSSDKEMRSDEDEDDAVSPFDMNLGREKAGGGNRGERAKMGKLIIYNEGLKMLDLIVAANMGIWWGVWEKSF